MRSMTKKPPYMGGFARQTKKENFANETNAYF